MGFTCPSLGRNEREHAVEAVERLDAPLRPGGEQDFGVAARAEGVAQALELLLQFTEVVELAVVADDVAAIVRRHRLAPVQHRHR